jgi:hypothetical protein
MGGQDFSKFFWGTQSSPPGGGQETDEMRPGARSCHAWGRRQWQGHLHLWEEISVRLESCIASA